jgi:hypothetical protein
MSKNWLRKKSDENWIESGKLTLRSLFMLNTIIVEVSKKKDGSLMCEHWICWCIIMTVKRLTAQRRNVLSSSFSSKEKKRKKREMQPLALLTVIKKRSSFVVHNWRAYKYIAAVAHLLD